MSMTLRRCRWWSICLIAAAAAFAANAAEPPEQPPPQSGAPAPATSSSPSTRTDSVHTPKALPESESDLRQLLSDNNRKIEGLETEVKDWSAALGSLEERLQTIPTPRNDLDQLLQAAEGAVTSKNAAQTLNALQALYGAFFGPTLNQAYPPYGDQERFADPSSPAKVLLNKAQSQLAAVSQEYYTPVNNWSSATGVMLYPVDNSRPNLPSIEKVKELRQIYTQERQKAYFDKLTNVLNDAIRTATAARSKAMQDRDSSYALRDQIYQSIDKGRKEINQLAIELGLPLFCGTVLLLFVIPFLFLRLGARGDAPSSSDPRNFQFGTLVEISTVLLLTMSILILGLAQKLEGPVLGTLLGGISGYVLNRTRSRSSTSGEKAAGG
jgi:hypothetical protein